MERKGTLRGVNGKLRDVFRFLFLLFSESETTVLSIMLKQEGKTSESDGKADSKKFEIKKNKMSREEEKMMERGREGSRESGKG